MHIRSSNSETGSVLENMHACLQVNIGNILLLKTLISRDFSNFFTSFIYLFIKGKLPGYKNQYQPTISKNIIQNIIRRLAN